MTRYALLGYDTLNLGDEIQSIAIEQFLPSIDLIVDRDRLNRLPDGVDGRYKIVLNGWHTRHPQNWPPSPALEPLLISLHLTNEIHADNKSGRRPAEALLEGESLEFFRSSGRIGARDTWTLKKLQEKNLDAYFSGCATLTLGSGSPYQRADHVCAVDLPEIILEQLRSRTRSRVVVTTHACRTPAPYAARAGRARRLLSLYARARCVVTSRLHCALPCLALGTPVLLILTAQDLYRFRGLEQFIRHCRPEDFAGTAFDIDAPPANGDTHLRFRTKLVRQINAFIDPSAPRDRARNPFFPERDVCELAEIEEALVLKEERLKHHLREFWKRGPERSRSDFIAALANSHRAIGDSAEAERLMELAHRAPYTTEL
jgi:hypothetical protein